MTYTELLTAIKTMGYVALTNGYSILENSEVNNERLKAYYILPPEATDKLAIAERIAIALEEKEISVLRVIEKYATQNICQSFIIA